MPPTRDKTHFIVLSGKKQSGKTTVATYLHKRLFGLKHKITSFATPIKQFCQDVLGFTQEQITGTDEEKNSLTEIYWDCMPAEIRWNYAIRPDVDESYDHIETKFLDRAIMRNGPMTAREVMQIFGTDIIRKCFGFDTWAKVPFQKYANSDHDIVIIDDCRFPNEADMALKHNALLIRLKRNVLGEDVHLSEKALDNYDESKYHYAIDNSEYSLNELYDAVDSILWQEGL